MKGDRILAAWHGQPACDTCGVRHMALFCAVDDDALRQFRPVIDDLTFGPGSVVYRQGDHGDWLFTVRGGLIKLLHYLPNGHQRIVRLHRTGDSAGLEATLGGAYEHTAITILETMVCRIPAAAVTRLAEEVPALGRRLMEQWHGAVVQADDWLTMLATGPARARVARLFLYLRGDGCTDHCPFLAREEAAAILALTTETVSRMVAEFRREGVISGGSGNAFHCDFKRLEKIALD